MIGQEERQRQSAKADWEKCLSEVAMLIGNGARLCDQQEVDEFDPRVAGRLAENAVMMIDMYVRQPPPSPTLAFTLSAARSYAKPARDAVREWLEISPQYLQQAHQRRVLARTRVVSALNLASENLEALVEEYHRGIL